MDSTLQEGVKGFRSGSAPIATTTGGNSCECESATKAKTPDSAAQLLRDKRACMVVFSHYPYDPRVRRAAEALVRQGMIVELICIKENPSDLSRETFNGVQITRVPVQRKRGGKLGYFLQYGSIITFAGAILTWRGLKRRYDLIHVHNMPDLLVFSALVPKLRGSRVILDLHDPMPELMMAIYGFHQDSGAVRLLKWFEKKSIGFADRVITVNQVCKKIFSSRSCAAEKIEVVMNAPDESIFKYKPVMRNNNPARPFVIMYHGSIVERHGLDLAIQALEKVRLSIPRAELRIYGQKTLFLEQAMKLAERLELAGAVHFLGPKKLEEIARAIDECDVGVISNRRSIFTEINTPTRIFEYLSRGKAVVAPAAPGISDYFNDGQLVFFELGDADDLAAKLIYVALHTEEIERIVQRGQEVYLAHQWARERDRFVNLVAGLLRPN